MENKIIVFTDGGSRSNPGPAALGVVILNEAGHLMKKYGQYLGQATNNEAEYGALIFALKKIKALYGKDKVKNLDVEIKSDSELMVNQMNGRYKLSDPKIQRLFIEAWNLKIDYGKVRFTVIPREQNKEADAMVNETLDSEIKNQRLI